MQLDASAKTCNSNADSSGKLKPYHLGISIDGNSCKVAFQSFHRCFKSGGSSSSQSNFRFHNSWMIGLGLSVAGASIPRGSNIELIKLRTPLFEVGKVLFTALI